MTRPTWPPSVGLLFLGLMAVAGVVSAAAAARLTGPSADADSGPPTARSASISEGGESVRASITVFPQPMLANVTDDYQVVRLWPRSDSGAAREALDQRCQAASFVDAPLREVVATLAEKAGVPLSLDARALEDMGLDPDTPLTATLTGLSYRAGLRRLLQDIDLAVVFRDDQVVITSREKAEDARETVFFPVIAGVDLDEVALLIEESVAPESWAHRGGPGTIVIAPPGMGHGVVISHNADVLEEIEAVLRHLDEALWVPVQQDEDVTASFVRSYAVHDDDTRAGLEARLLDICNDALPHGADPDARIDVIGRSIVVRSRSRAFQVMAAQILAAIVGEELAVEIDAEEAASVSENDT